MTNKQSNNNKKIISINKIFLKRKTRSQKRQKSKIKNYKDKTIKSTMMNQQKLINQKMKMLKPECELCSKKLIYFYFIDSLLL